MAVPQPARDLARSDDSYLQERIGLLSKKYAGGLDSQESARLAQIEEYLDSQDSTSADLIESRSSERMGRIDATLDRVEKAIRDLQTTKLQ